jgi:hypothetical protein
MFYRAIGFIVWKVTVAYVRERYSHLKKPAAALTVAAAIAAIYAATHDE